MGEFSFLLFKMDLGATEQSLLEFHLGSKADINSNSVIYLNFMQIISYKTNTQRLKFKYGT